MNERWRQLGKQLLCPLAAAATTVLLCIPVLSYPYGFDQSVFATVSDSMLRGGILYKDAWDLKPPGIYWIYSLTGSILGQDFWAIRVVELIALGLSGAGMVMVSRRRFGSGIAGLAGAVVLSLMYCAFLLSSGGNSAQAESFQIPVFLFSAWLWPNSSDTRRVGLRCFLTGGLIGTLALLKTPTGLFLGLCILDRLLMDGAKSTWGERLRYSLITLGGAATLALVVALSFVTAGAFHELLEATIEYPIRYARFASESTVAGGLGRFSREMYHLMPIGAILLLSLGICRGVQTHRSETIRWVLIVFTGWSVVAVQGKFFDYHHLILAPGVALGIGLAFLGGLKFGESWTRKILAVAVLLTAGIYVYQSAAGYLSLIPRYGRVARLTLPRTLPAYKNLIGPAEMALIVRERTGPADRILVWGNEPSLYVFSGRPIAGRFTQVDHLLPPWKTPERLEAYLIQVSRARPKLVVVCSGDGRWGRPDSASRLAWTPDMKSWLEENYSRSEGFGRFELWTLREDRP